MFCLSHPLSCFDVCGHHLSPRIAIVFSLLCSVPNFSLPPFVYFPQSPPLRTHPVPPCTFHILPLCEFYSPLPCHKGTSVHLLPPPLDCCLYLFLLSGREGGGGNQHTTKAPKHERRGQRNKKNPNAVRTNGCKIGRSIRRGAACWSCGRPV